MRYLPLLLVATLFVILPAAPAQGACKDAFGLVETSTVCYDSGADLRTYMRSSEGAQYVYRFTQLCTDDAEGSVCDSPRACLVGGVAGTRYAVLRRASSIPDDPFEAYAVVCLTAGEEDDFEVVPWRLVMQAMKRLSWPEAVLVVQPVGGETLVNFETNFYAEARGPVVQRVSLLGRRFEIEARPVSWRWHFDEGVWVVGDDPGAPHVDGRPHRVFHVYEEAGVRVHPSVDVRYEGRFREVGESGWSAPFPERVTVPGTPVDLDVLSAQVHLVG